MRSFVPGGAAALALGLAAPVCAADSPSQSTAQVEVTVASAVRGQMWHGAGRALARGRVTRVLGRVGMVMIVVIVMRRGAQDGGVDVYVRGGTFGVVVPPHARARERSRRNEQRARQQRAERLTRPAAHETRRTTSFDITKSG
jgi:hypothetical protein